MINNFEYYNSSENLINFKNFDNLKKYLLKHFDNSKNLNYYIVGQYSTFDNKTELLNNFEKFKYLKLLKSMLTKQNFNYLAIYNDDNLIISIQLK